MIIQVSFGRLMSLVLRWHNYKLYIGTSRGKNALKFAYLQKALSFLDGELELLRLKIQHPEQFLSTHPPTFKSNLFFAFKPKGLGIIGMAEIVVSLWLLGEIIGTDGKPVPLIRIANAFEYIILVSGISTISRKPSLTVSPSIALEH